MRSARPRPVTLSSLRGGGGDAIRALRQDGRGSSRRRLAAAPADGRRKRVVSIALIDARGIHHLGVAVQDLEEALETYTRLFGAELERRAEVPAQGVEAAAVRVGNSLVELVTPLGGDTPVGRFLAKRGQGMHHVAFEVDDIRTALESLREEGAILVADEPHTGLFGLEVAFVHPDSVHGVLAEVVSHG